MPGADRNAGIRQARGDLLIFIDDDCYVAPDLVDDWLHVFATNDVGYGTGRVLPYGPENAIGGFFRDSPVERRMPGGSYVPPGFMQGSNMAFSRACLQASGLFDPLFGSGVRYAAEDWDIALRASFAGHAGGYFPTPTVSHDHQRSEREARARMGFYYFGFGAVFAKHSLGPKRATILNKFWRYAVRHSRSHRMSFVGGFLDYLARHAGRRDPAYQGTVTIDA